MKKFNGRRWGVYFAGMISLALGIILSSKTGLGVAPLVSLAYCVAGLNGFNFSDCCMVMYTLFFVIEELVKFRRARWFDVLQVPFCYLFTRVMSLFSAMLPNAPNIFVGIILTIPAVLFTGLGVVLMVEMRLVPNPSDGLVQAVSDRTGVRMGLVKNVFDISCVCLALAIGLVWGRRVIGVGIGTVIAMICNGRAVALFKRLLGKYLARIDTGETQQKSEEKQNG